MRRECVLIQILALALVCGCATVDTVDEAGSEPAAKPVTQRNEEPAVAFSFKDAAVTLPSPASVKLRNGEKLELRIFIDRSILEVFANGRQCITQRIYPTRKDSTGIELFSKGGSMIVESLQAWDMAATNPW